MARLLELIKIFFKSISQYKVIVIFIVISQIVSSFIALFTYSQVFMLAQNAKGDAGEYNIILNEPMRLSEFSTIAAKFADVGDTTFKLRLEKDIDIFSFYPISRKCCVALYSGRDVDINSSTPEILIAATADEALGDFTDFNGISYQIVGKTYDDTYYVNFNSLDQSTSIYGITASNIDARTRRQAIKYAKLLEENFERDVAYSKYISAFEAFSSPDVIILSLFVISIAVASFSIGFGYLITKAKSTFFVMRLMGQSKLSLYFMSVVSLAIVVILQFIIASCFFSIFDALAIPNMGGFAVGSKDLSVFRLDISDYAILGTIFTLFSSLVVATTSLSSVRVKNKGRLL